MAPLPGPGGRSAYLPTPDRPQQQKGREGGRQRAGTAARARGLGAALVPTASAGPRARWAAAGERQSRDDRPGGAGEVLWCGQGGNGVFTPTHSVGPVPWGVVSGAVRGLCPVVSAAGFVSAISRARGASPTPAAASRGTRCPLHPHRTNPVHGHPPFQLRSRQLVRGRSVVAAPAETGLLGCATASPITCA